MHAVEAALDTLPGGVDACLILGDLVGYNADPAACPERSLQIADCCIRGNHDKVVAGISSDRDFNEVAQAAAPSPADAVETPGCARSPQGPV